MEQSNSLRQEQVMSQRQLHSLQLLQLPTLALQEKIMQELETNPVLELEAPPEELLPGNLSELGSAESVRNESGSGDDDADVFEELYSGDGNYLDELPLPPEEVENPELSSSREYRMNSLTRGETLQEHLFSELACSGMTAESARIAAELIGGIDDDGYLRTHPADVAQSLGISLAEVEAVLARLQCFGPPGVGARSAAECLLLQLRAKGRDDEVMRRLLLEFGDDLAANRLPKVAHELGLTMEELNVALGKLKKLNPYPGRIFAGTETEFVAPDMEVAEENGVWVLKMEERTLPRLRLAEYYTNLLSKAGLTREEKSYLQEKMASAKELMKSLALRKSTLRRIGEILLETQQNFWADGPAALKPLTMREVAGQLEMHETTVSRAIANKYLLCRQGFFELKYFFTNGFVSEDGESVSKRAIYEKIRELVAGENPAKPLSDDRISQLLAEEKFNVARRTVAKYREALGIAPTNLRRKF